MQTTQRQFKLNIPEDVKKWLSDEAEKNLRSQTAEIILALKEKMKRQALNEKGSVSA